MAGIGTHATPGLREKAYKVKPVVVTKKILEDLEGLTLTDRLFKSLGYRAEKFTDTELRKMCHCKTCGLRVSTKAENRRQKPTKAEKQQERERKERMEETLDRKLREVLPALKSREDNFLSCPPDEEESWEAPWPTDEPEDPTKPSGRCISCNRDSRIKYDPTEFHGLGDVRHTAWWQNDAKIWVSFDFTLNKHEARLFVKPVRDVRPKCQSHSGRVRDARWTCCGSSPLDLGCIIEDSHQMVENVEEFRQDMQLFPTPGDKATDVRTAITLDCEMGITQRGEAELIWVTAVDFFTGEVLLDSLVYPKMPMRHLNTRHSGVTWRMLNNANSKWQCLDGRDDARRRLFQWVGPETFVLVHGGNGDLLALRWIHPRVVDTVEVETRRLMPEPQRTLKNLAKIHLKRRVQQGREGHDCLEDTIACRDLTKWYIDHLPDDVKVRNEDDSGDEHPLARVDPRLVTEWIDKMTWTWYEEEQTRQVSAWDDPIESTAWDDATESTPVGW